ncbi:ECF transporter S component [Vagococcus intermedius]|uniref:ECF transporter S component n=1 Tax=Vagococcus intermedius TaxID=2991418 RepID=A0AAF0CTM3_9ENTE|nr:ECF transporter S component [Vagococcus intermedius]WEG72745.1 ECF transporter S component [Vagococcus intermedius]WEG74831.1 ECF transporter S component [Vagococcus intermedius]
MTTKKLTWVSMLLAMCVLGANFKLLGSIALDSFPAFLGAMILGPVYGAFLGIAGHFVSALLAGFPQTLPIHIIIGFLMGICMFIFGLVRKKAMGDGIMVKAVSWLIAYIVSVPLNLLILYPVLHEVVFVLFVPLTIATLANLLISELVYAVLPSKIKNFGQSKVV